MINLRNENPEFRRSIPDDFKFLDVGKQVALAYVLQDKFIVIMNGETEKELKLDLPSGDWKMLESTTDLERNNISFNEGITIPATSGLILKRNT
jgi:hypothetical protein